MRILAFALLSAVLTGVAGCGGHDDPLPSVPPASGMVPPDALASPAAFTTFVGQLQPDDAAEPLVLDGVVPPASDTDEPAEI